MDFKLSSDDLPKFFLSIIFITFIIISFFWIVKPFIIGFSWASMVVISTWPLLIKIQKILFGKRFLAVIVMIILLLIFFILPISILISGIIENIQYLFSWTIRQDRFKLPNLSWIEDIPVIGKNIYYFLNSLYYKETFLLINKIHPYIGKLASWVIDQLSNLGNLLFHSSLMIFFSGILYANGEKISFSISNMFIKIWSNNGISLLLLSVQAIRSVALGIFLTAIIQSILSSIGLMIVEIPLINVLTMIIFIFCITQLGPFPILLPTIFWLYWSGNIIFGTILLIWSFLILTLDNVLKSILISIGANIPVIIVLCGVLGGLISFGMIGLFIGPVILSISWFLMISWIHNKPLSSIIKKDQKILK